MTLFQNVLQFYFLKIKHLKLKWNTLLGGECKTLTDWNKLAFQITRLFGQFAAKIFQKYFFFNIWGTVSETTKRLDWFLCSTCFLQTVDRQNTKLLLKVFGDDLPLRSIYYLRLRAEVKIEMFQIPFKCFKGHLCKSICCKASALQPV